MANDQLVDVSVPFLHPNTTNMEKLLLLSAVVAVALSVTGARPLEEDVAITNFGSNVEVDGSYGYTYALSNGVSVSEEGLAGQEVRGSYSYVAPDGQPISISYVANADGFQPSSDVLPVGPPIPDYILRSIEYIQTHPSEEELIDRQVRAQRQQEDLRL